MPRTLKINGVTLYGDLADVAARISPEDWDYFRFADTISDLIAEYMDKHQVTKAGLAERLGTSRAFVSKVLAGNANMTLKTLSRILHHLDAKPEVKIVSKADKVQWLGIVTSEFRRGTVRDWWRAMPRSSKTTMLIPSDGECEKVEAA